MSGKKAKESSFFGSLPFEGHFDGLETITDCFDVELRIPRSYPDDLPLVRETEGVIKAPYSHVNADGTLCLCVPIGARLIFHKAPTLLGFVNNLVVPFLYGYCYWKKYGEHPFGEQKHGSAGIVQYYRCEFDLKGEAEAIEVIWFLNKYGYDGRLSCPCGSGRMVKKCHGKKLREFHHRHTPQTLKHDLKAIASYCRAKQD